MAGLSSLQVLDVTNFGAQAQVRNSVVDASVSTNTVTSMSAVFAPGDVGKTISITNGNSGPPAFNAMQGQAGIVGPPASAPTFCCSCSGAAAEIEEHSDVAVADHEVLEQQVAGVGPAGDLLHLDARRGSAQAGGCIWDGPKDRHVAEGQIEPAGHEDDELVHRDGPDDHAAGSVALEARLGAGTSLTVRSSTLWSNSSQFLASLNSSGLGDTTMVLENISYQNSLPFSARITTDAASFWRSRNCRVGGTNPNNGTPRFDESTWPGDTVVAPYRAQFFNYAAATGLAAGYFRPGNRQSQYIANEFPAAPIIYGQCTRVYPNSDNITIPLPRSTPSTAHGRDATRLSSSKVPCHTIWPHPLTERRHARG